MPRNWRPRDVERFIVGVSRIVLEMSGNDDLKAKRSIVSKVRDRVTAKWNVSFAEVGPQDVMDEAVFGIAAVSNDRDYLQKLLAQIPDFIDGLGVGRVISEDVDITPY